MKKQLLYTLATVASLGLASCNGDYTDWANPQTNGPEEAAAKYGVTFTAGPEANGSMADEDGTIQLVTVNSDNAEITGYTIKSLTINGEKVDASMTGNNITVDATTICKLVEKQKRLSCSSGPPAESGIDRFCQPCFGRCRNH